LGAMGRSKTPNAGENALEPVVGIGRRPTVYETVADFQTMQEYS